MDPVVVAIFALVYLSMILGEFPGSQTIAHGMALPRVDGFSSRLSFR